MPFISREDAVTAVGPYLPDLETIVRSAWQDWLGGGLAHQMQHKRVRAGYVWNQLLANAKRVFEGRSGVRVEAVKGWDGVLIDDRIFIRMKKGDTRLFSRNYPTKTALAFHDQAQDLFGGVVRLELLYILDKSETEVEQIVLIQRHKSSIVWSIDLADVGGALDTQSVIPFVPTPLSGTPAQRMIKPKEGDKENEQREPRSGS